MAQKLICKMPSKAASCSSEDLSIRRICNALQNADKSANTSPKPNLNSNPPEIKNNPMKAKKTPAIFEGWSFLRKKNTRSNGTMTTLSEDMNAEFEDEVKQRLLT